MSGFIRGATTWALGLVLVLLPGYLSAQSPPTADQPFEQGLLAVCDHAAQSFLEQFNSRLDEAGVKGPVAVLEFFGQDLPALEQGFSNSRIRLSLLGRHPGTRDDQEDVFDRTAMAGFSRAGGKSAKVVGFFVNPPDSRRQYRFYREVRAGESCLTCHGPEKKVKAEVRELVQHRFPGYDGFGHQAGEVLGAVGIRVRDLAGE